MTTYGSLFTGIGGLDYGLDAAGFECKWQVEFDPQASGVLARHWPNVTRYGDVTQVKGADLEPVDVLVGGWPCQDLSVAGKRAGLAGKRSGLFYEFMRLIDELSPTWVLAENVPGLLSAGCKPKCDGGCVPTHGGAMGSVIEALADRGYGYAWRVLDAQYVGLAQRRKRVFIVGHLGTPWSAPAEVLFEPESLQGDPPARSQARKVTSSRPAKSAGEDDRDGRGSGVVAALSATGVGTCGADDNQAQAGHLIATHPVVAHALTAPLHGKRYDFESESLAFSVYPTRGAQDLAATQVDVAPALTARAEATKTDRGTRIVQAFAENQRAEVRFMDISPQLNTGGGKPGQGYSAAMDQGLVRRLTPTECERLQGFPDGWTAVDADGKLVSDSVRYRMLGNAVATACSSWIARRLATVIDKGDE